MIKGVIFDFNGTMFFDSQENEIAWRQFIADFFKQSISDEEFNLHIHGRSNQAALEYLLQRSITPRELSQYTEQKETIYRDLCLKSPDRLCLVDGLPELLDQLTQANIPIGIATSAEKSNLDFYLLHFDLLKWFPLERIIYNDGTFSCKPDPTIYLKAAKSLEILPSQCIVFEDSPSGIQSAKDANIGKIIAVSPLENQTLLKNYPEVDHIVSNFIHFDLSCIK